MWRNNKRPLLMVVVFLAMQVLGSMLMVGAYMLSGRTYDPLHPDIAITAGALMICNILTILAIWLIGRKPGPEEQTPIVTLCEHGVVKGGCWLFIFSLFGIIAMNLAAEFFDLPDILEDTFLEMGRMPLGILAAAVAAPVAEETLFRWGIMRHYIQRGYNPWAAIMISAVLFGIIHMNPAQIPFAIGAGVLLGIMYWQTGSIWWSIALHVVNNGMACVQILVLGDKAKDFSMIDFVGGTTPAIIITLICTIICVGGIYKVLRPTT